MAYALHLASIMSISLNPELRAMSNVGVWRIGTRTMCSDEDLDLIECAIHRVLKQEAAQQASESDAQAENVPQAEVAVEHAEAGMNTRSITLLSRLLQEVHAMRMKRASEQNNPVEQEEPWVLEKGKESTNPADAAAVKAAVAAADAAQATAASVAKNSEIIEVLLETVRVSRQETEDIEDEDDSHTKAAKKVSEKRTVVKIVKDLHKQNMLTHVILGLMVITTAYWRFKEISWVLRLRKVMSNPWEAVGGIFGGDPQFSHKEEVETKTLQLPKLELPKILQMNVEEKISP